MKQLVLPRAIKQYSGYGYFGGSEDELYTPNKNYDIESIKHLGELALKMSFVVPGSLSAADTDLATKMSKGEAGKKYTNAMVQLVRKMQGIAGISVDGDVGPNTWKKFKEIASNFTPTSSSSSSETSSSSSETSSSSSSSEAAAGGGFLDTLTSWIPGWSVPTAPAPSSQSGNGQQEGAGVGTTDKKETPAWVIPAAIGGGVLVLGLIIVLATRK
jgi:peptidoglycan hydrolase-like protein with peptidoglycan-binding domain